MKIERVKTGIKGLDEMLGGGLLRETANLVEGAPGTGKTTLGMQFIYNGIMQDNEPGLIITFEEFPQQYYHDAAAFGWDFKELEKKGMLKIIMTSPEVSRMDIESVGGIAAGATGIHQVGAVADRHPGGEFAHYLCGGGNLADGFLLYAQADEYARDLRLRDFAAHYLAHQRQHLVVKDFALFDQPGQCLLWCDHG